MTIAIDNGIAVIGPTPHRRRQLGLRPRLRSRRPWSVSVPRSETRQRCLVLLPGPPSGPLTPEVIEQRRSNLGKALAVQLRRALGAPVDLRHCGAVETLAPEDEGRFGADYRDIRITCFAGLNALLVDGPRPLGMLLCHGSRQRGEIVVRAPRRITCKVDHTPAATFKSLTPELQWHLGATAGINASPDRPAEGNGIWIGFVDSGIDQTHAEFRGKAFRFCRVTRTGRRDDNAPPADPHGHGTFCAALACGRDSGAAPAASIAMAGAPLDMADPLADIFQQVLAAADFLLGLDKGTRYAGVDVLNFSLGVWESSQIKAMKRVFEHVRTRNAIVCAASGNAPPAPCPGGNAFCPSTVRGVWSIGAHTKALRVWDGSCNAIVGSPARPRVVPRYYAPGDQVVSAVPGGGYTSMSGTSMACAIASGVAAAALGRRRTNDGEFDARGIGLKTTPFFHGGKRLRRLISG